MNASPPVASRPLKVYALAAKCLLWLLLAAWLALALAWGALHGWIVPRIGEWRPALEMEAARALGVPVRIGSISARTEGLIPSFELREVVLLDPQGREALRLPRVLAALSPRSVLHLGFEQLYIDAPQLDIRRTADGHILVAGLDFSRASDNEGRAADWFFQQGEFALRGGMIRWSDEMRAAPPLALSDVDFVVRNRARRHSVRLDATPPAEWGSRFTLQGQFRQPLLSGRDGQWKEWVGQIYADFGRVDLSQLRQHADIGVQIAQGRGAVRAWADVVRGQVTGGTADVALAQVEATLGAKLAPLALHSVSGRLGGKRLDEGFEFHTQDLQFETVEGVRWPGGNVSVSWNAGSGTAPAQGELRADRLDLLALTQIASKLPLGTPTHAALTAYNPRGLVETVQAKWQGPLSAPVKYEARGRAVALEIAARPAPGSSAPAAAAAAAASSASSASSGVRTAGAHPHAGIPGVRGATIDFDFTQAGGKAKLAIESGALEFPGVFEEPLLPMNSLAADVQWQLKGQDITLSVDNLRFSNADAEGQAQATWKTGDGRTSPRFPGVLDLQASLSRADGTRVFRYLPLGVPKPARDYVRDGVQQGRATDAKARVRGDLRRFPWADGRDGEFLITAKVHDALFAYVPPGMNRGPGAWPALAQLDGELVFQGNGMQVKDANGRFAGAPGVQVKADAQIPDFHQAVVGVQGQFKGPLGESLAIVNGSPISAVMNGALSRARANGVAEVKLQLTLPVARIETSKVGGTVTLAGNDVQITPDSPWLTRARGAVTFSEKGFALVGAQARALGGDVRLEGGTRGGNGAAGSANDAAIVLRAQGTATAEGMRQAPELGFLARLARDMSGSTAYSIVLGIRQGTPEVLVTSSLQGMAVQLPAPLNKTADAALPLRYETALLRDAGSAPRMQDRLLVELGRAAAVNYVRDVSQAEPRVLRGTIAIGASPADTAMPEAGVLANIQLPSVDVDAWEAVLDRMAASAPGAALRGNGNGNADGGAGMGYLPTTMAVRAKELRLEGRTLRDVTLGGSRDGLTWRANVDAQELDGYLEYRQPSDSGPGRVHARLSRLMIGASDAKDVEAILDQQPASIPALDVVVDDFELKGRKLGRLEIDAVNRGAAGVREWRLNKLSLSSAEAIFTASGNWAAINAQAAGALGRVAGDPKRRTVMNFRLDIADAGGTLARFGMKDIVRRGRGKMEGQVSWMGSPLSLDYPSLAGSFNVNVESGQFLKADPGLAKLMGVLSLQSLPRRLALDFRDVFSEGFAFDFIRGDVTIQQGIASTNNLQMKGVNAAVLMEGKADIAHETQDLKVVVVPEINAGTASLVATVINPAVGLGSFLAQIFLRQPLIRATTQEFHVDGTWADPHVTKVARSASPAPATTTGEAGSETKGETVR